MKLTKEVFFQDEHNAKQTGENTMNTQTLIANTFKTEVIGKTFIEAFHVIGNRAVSQKTHSTVTTFDFVDGSLIQLQYWGSNHPAGFEYTIQTQDKRY